MPIKSIKEIPARAAIINLPIESSKSPDTPRQDTEPFWQLIYPAFGVERTLSTHHHQKYIFHLGSGSYCDEGIRVRIAVLDVAYREYK